MIISANQIAAMRDEMQKIAFAGAGHLKAMALPGAIGALGGGLVGALPGGSPDRSWGTPEGRKRKIKDVAKGAVMGGAIGAAGGAIHHQVNYNPTKLKMKAERFSPTSPPPGQPDTSRFGQPRARNHDVIDID